MGTADFGYRLGKESVLRNSVTKDGQVIDAVMVAYVVA